MTYKVFSDLLQKHNVSAYAVHKATGVSQSTLSDWKLGKSEPKLDKLQKIADYFKVPVSIFSNAENADVLPVANVYEIPIYESVSAGLGAYASSSVLGYMPIYLDNASLAAETLCIRVKGDSMYPKIENGDTVVVHKTDYVESGTIAVVMFEDEGYIKRIEYAGEKVILHSINPMYPPLTFEGADVARLRVVGKVVKIVKDL